MTTSFLTFALAGSAYAIPLGRVREVVGCHAVVRVPNAAECVRGVMNLRGNVVPVIDLARRLGAGDTTLSDTTCALLIEATLDDEHTAIAGLVEEIHGVVELADDAINNTPSFGTPVDPALIRGIATTEHERFAYVLDPDEVLAGIA
jgi:purine-binding chemotaxis protein CheW